MLWAAGPAAAQPGSVVSRASISSAGAQANQNSFSSALSRDGRVVAFTSSATNLRGCATGQQIYVHDRATGTTSCVSVDGSAVPGNLGSDGPTLSADGRVVAFTSSASNLGGSCVNQQVYVHDRTAGTTSCVSINAGGSRPTAAPSAQA
jgi:Tol biopolymer transport system component